MVLTAQPAYDLIFRLKDEDGETGIYVLQAITVSECYLVLNHIDLGIVANIDLFTQMYNKFIRHQDVYIEDIGHLFQPEDGEYKKALQQLLLLHDELQKVEV